MGGAARVFDEYGLIISGWSAEWDTALVRLIESTPNRRYPLYWDARSGKGVNAQKLLAARSGQIVPAAGADEMFSELSSALEALDRLAEPPLTTAMAVTRLKRYLPDPVRRIDLHDLVMEAADKVVEGVRDQPLSIDGLDGTAFQEVLAAHQERSRQLCALLVTGAWHDLDADHDRLWMDVLERLIDAGTTSRMGGPVQQVLEQARRYSALLVQTAVGVAATRRGRDTLIIKLATEVMGTIDAGVKIRRPACQVIHPYRVLDNDWVNALPRWNGGAWTYPLSRLLKADVRAIFADLIPEDSEYMDTFHNYEYRMSLLHESTNATYSVAYRAMPGEYVGEQGWSWDDRNVPLAEITFRDAGQRSTNWPWVRFLGGDDAYDRALIDHRGVLENLSITTCTEQTPTCLTDSARQARASYRRLKVHPSAVEHGVSTEDAIQAAEWSHLAADDHRLPPAQPAPREGTDEQAQRLVSDGVPPP